MIKPKFSDNTWDDIIDACWNRTVPETWKVGDSKVMPIGAASYLVDIIGKDFDHFQDGSSAPLTFGLHDCWSAIAPLQKYPNATRWSKSYMRNTVLAEILFEMDIGFSQAIAPVRKRTGMGFPTAEGVEITYDKLFLFSACEITSYSNLNISPQIDEGVYEEEYPYFTSAETKAKKYQNSPSTWQTRSPRDAWGGNEGLNLSIGDEGYGAVAGKMIDPSPFCFGFCFKATDTYFQTPVTDRTIDDARKDYLSINANLLSRGCLNHQDLNRIENNFKFLNNRLNEDGIYNPCKFRDYIETTYPDGTNPVRKRYTDWHEENIPWFSEINRIRFNLNFMETYLKNLGLPFFDMTNSYVDYEEVNDWENVELVCKETIEKMEEAYIHCRTVNCGGDLLL